MITSVVQLAVSPLALVATYVSLVIPAGNTRLVRYFSGNSLMSFVLLCGFVRRAETSAVLALASSTMVTVTGQLIQGLMYTMVEGGGREINFNCPISL